MPFKKIAITATLFLLTVNARLPAQTSQALPRSVPEAEGVSSEGILHFLEAAGKSDHEFHSFMFLRHGKVIAEGWWNPYRADLKHTLYSVSKSFTATAIGFAVSEKRLTVEDKVASFFPRDLPDTSDWEQGYCYQMWRCRHNAFRADGAYGQYIVVMPDQDAVVVITSETADLQGELNLVWQYLLPAMQPEKLPVNGAGAARLK